MNDPYVKRAKAEGARARALYKLQELDEQFHLVKRGQRVIDLGAAPGGWAQYCVKKNAGAVVGIDLLPIDPLTGATFFEHDFLADDAPDLLMQALGGKPDLVLSDMAANTTGPFQDRPDPHRRAGGGSCRICSRAFGVRRRVRDESVSGRAGCSFAGSAEIEFRQRQARQTAREPQ